MPAESKALIDVAIAGAVTAVVSGPFAFETVDRVRELALDCQFAYGSGGTTAKAWVQTSFDHGATWMDIFCFAATTAAKRRLVNLTVIAVTSPATPVDGTTADDTAVNGFLGGLFRVKYTTTGTYAGATGLKIYAVPK
jgi:hypothetical protein